MLSDRFIEKNSQNFKSDLNTKILRLEHLSVSMANLIASGNSDKIMHLEKIRKKILIDILKEKKTFSKENKSQIKNIITLNSELIQKMKDEKRATLGKIKREINFYKSTKSNH